MKKRVTKEFVLENLRAAVPMMIFIVCYFVSFSILENMTRLRYYVIHSPLDDMIPFCEYFVIPYFSWFPYVAIGVSFMLVLDRENYQKLAWMLYLGMSIFIVISAVYPNILYLRPEVMPRDNIFCRMVQHLYNSDTPTNVAPSIHVFNTLAILCSIYHSKARFATNKFFRGFYTIDGILIILSTMLIKQHSVYDVAGAFIMFAILYIPVYHPELLPRRSRKPVLNSNED